MRSRILIAAVITTIAVAFGVVISQPRPATAPATSDVARKVWALSNPAHRLYIHQPAKVAAKPTPGRPAPPPTSAAPTAPTAPTVPSAPTATAPPTSMPTMPAPTDIPTTSAPTTATPSEGPTSENPPGSDSPTAPPSSGPVGGVSADYPMPTGDLDDWRVTYADDFTGPLNQKSAWSIYSNGVVPSNPSTGYWSPSHVSVADSMLTINGAPDAALAPDGRIVSAGLGLWKLPRQTYGKWELLVRMDACTQVKYAWMLWPVSNKWPADGEIDFAEDEGGARKSTVASIIYPGANGAAATLPQNRLTPDRPMSDWHVVGVEWTPGLVRYTLDGKVWGTVVSPHVPSNPMTLVLQTEGKAAPAAIASDFASCNAQVGWVVQYAMK